MGNDRTIRWISIGGLDMKLLREDCNYEIHINFKQTDSGTRQPIAGIIKRSHYKKILDDLHYGKTAGTYEFWLEGIKTEMTFPVQEVDTITVVPEVKHE